MKKPNPQGKGLSLATAFLSEAGALAISPPKQISQVANELFTSLFVLQSRFSFKPVSGQDYWLYQGKQQFRLSLIGPQEWHDEQFGFYIGRCQLHEDMTWSIELSSRACSNSTFMHYLEQSRQQFEQKLQAVSHLHEVLPGYRAELPFYQRAFVTLLSKSLGISLHRAGLSSVDYLHAKQLEQSHETL